MEDEEQFWGKPQSGSLYITLDEGFKATHISTKGNGKDGLMEFMKEDIKKALESTQMPSG